MPLEIISTEDRKPNYAFVIVLVIGIIAFLLEANDFKLAGLIFPVLGVALVYLVFKERRDKYLSVKMKEDWNWKFLCSECDTEIKEPVKHQNIDGQPLIYHCEKCEILWHTGSYSS